MGIQLDITMKDPKEASKPTAAAETAGGQKSAAEEPAPKENEAASGTLEVGNGGAPASSSAGESGQAAGDMGSLLAGLESLARRDGDHGQEAGQDDGVPLAKEAVGPREKQLQRSVVGTVSCF